jgi:hypothetical protein
MSRCVWALTDEDVTEMLATLIVTDMRQLVFDTCASILKEDGIIILTSKLTRANSATRFDKYIF